MRFRGVVENFRVGCERLGLIKTYLSYMATVIVLVYILLFFRKVDLQMSTEFSPKGYFKFVSTSSDSLLVSDNYDNTYTISSDVLHKAEEINYGTVMIVNSIGEPVMSEYKAGLIDTKISKYLVYLIFVLCIIYCLYGLTYIIEDINSIDEFTIIRDDNDNNNELDT